MFSNTVPADFDEATVDWDKVGYEHEWHEDASSYGSRGDALSSHEAEADDQGADLLSAAGSDPGADASILPQAEVDMLKKGASNEPLQ